MKPFSELTDVEVAEFIANKMGWQKNRPDIGNHWKWFYLVKDNLFKFTEYTVLNHDVDVWDRDWNPMHSLDQCFIMEEWTIENDLWDKYSYILERICLENTLPVHKNLYCSRRRPLHATHKLRCQAFYEAMGEIEE